jgi:hypothetical protein
MKWLIPLLFCSGCAHLSSETTKYDAATGYATERTEVRVSTLWDSQSSLTKFRNTTGQVGNGSNVWSYPSGTTIGQLDSSSTSTNITALAESLMSGAVQGMMKSIKP